MYHFDMPRTRQPELTRTALLEAARRVIRTQGATLSLDAVAREAGVSKGGLLHHYPTKERLLMALALALSDELQEEVEVAHQNEIAAHGDAPGAWLRAYIELSFCTDHDTQTLIANLLPLAALPDLDRELHKAQAFLIDRAEADGVPAARAHAIRLACDALWYPALPPLDERRRAELKEELLAWTRS